MNPLKKDEWITLARRFGWQLFVVQAVLFFAAGAYVAYTIGSGGHSDPVSATDHAREADGHSHSAGTGDDANTEPQWWTCAMHPQIRQQKPGNCPICQMELVPVQPSAGGLRTLTIKPSVRELMKVETAPVERKYVQAEIRMVGKVDYDETRMAHITAWVSGRIDRMYVDYTGVQVNQGDHMVYLYSEELYSIQEELIQALRFQRENPNISRGGGLDLVEAAREKLRLLGLTEIQIAEIEQRDSADEHLTIHSPASGIVIEKLKQQGDRVRTGDRIYTVADLNQVWVRLDAYESDLEWIRYGQEVQFSTEAYPGEKFTGRIAFIDPVLNKDTRTVKVRVNVDNRDGRLKPEMFVRAVVKSDVAAGGRILDAGLAGKWVSPMHPEIIRDAPGNCDICGMPLVRAETLGYVTATADPAAKPLVIPARAALVTGTRAIVYVDVEGAKDPTYEGREVLLGPRAGDYYLVRNGVHEGEMVVTNGNFKIDSALQIQAKPTMMTPEGGGGGGAHDHSGGDERRDGGGNESAVAMQLPAGFQQQLHDLVASANNVVLQLGTAQLDRICKSFSEFQASLNRVNAEGLEDHPAMLWKEFLMLLGNDAIEGSEAADIQIATRVVDSLQNNIRRMSEQFMLSHSSHSSHDGHSDHSAAADIGTIRVTSEFRMQLTMLLNSYFSLQSALAADDGPSAAETTSELLSNFKQIDFSALGGDAAENWLKESAALELVFDRLAAAQSIDTARSEFALLSEQLLAIIRTFGADTDVYELHCPMAFEGRGATWMQPDDQTRNPYFGASMLTCADLVRKVQLPHSDDTLPEDSGSDHSDSGHEGHQHE